MRREFTCAACGHPYYTEDTQSQVETAFLVLYGHSVSDMPAGEEVCSICDKCFAVFKQGVAAGVISLTK